MAEFKVNARAFKKDLKKISKYLKGRFPKQVFKDFKANTPKDSGNARRKTKMRNTLKGKVIIADYPYSGVIDKGGYPKNPVKGTGKTSNGFSTQAPKGIVNPTLKQAEEHFDRFLRSI